jgi:hypothetical protein
MLLDAWISQSKELNPDEIDRTGVFEYIVKRKGVKRIFLG